MNKFYQTFQSSYKSSQASIDRTISHYIHQWVCGQISENIFFFLGILFSVKYSGKDIHDIHDTQKSPKTTSYFGYLLNQTPLYWT